MYIYIYFYLFYYFNYGLLDYFVSMDYNARIPLFWWGVFIMSQIWSRSPVESFSIFLFFQSPVGKHGQFFF